MILYGPETFSVSPSPCSLQRVGALKVARMMANEYRPAQAFTDAKLLQRVKDEWTQDDSDIIHDLASGATGLLVTSLSLRDVRPKSYAASKHG